MKNENDCFEIEKVKAELRRLKIPPEFLQMDLEAINTHDISIFMSIRKDSGKTTNAILIGLICNYLYEYEIEYNRVDESQTTGSKIETLFDIIEKFDYISKIYRGKYNGVEYKSRQKKFFLVLRNKDYEIVARSPRPILIIHSLENHIDIKSSYNNRNGNIFLLDEMFDTKRSTHYQIVEFWNNVSTITRERPEARAILLGNNLNRYSFWFDEFCIMDEIGSLNFGGRIDQTTELGTTLFATLLEVSKKKRDEISKKKIRFFGFNTPKAAAFTGVQAFSGNQWQHLENLELLESEYLLYNRFYVFHRNRYIQIRLYSKDSTYYCYLNFSNKPKYKDSLILSTEPETGEKNQIYGFGEYSQFKKVKSRLDFIKKLRVQNQWYYSSNAVGDLMYDYFKTLR